MQYAFHPSPEGLGAWQAWLFRGIDRVFSRKGHLPVAPAEADVVFHQVEAAAPRPFPRRSRATFVVGAAVLEVPPADVLSAGYPLLVRSISNTLLVRPEGEDALAVWVITPELGCYRVSGEDEDGLFAQLYDRLSPLATSHLVIDNVFDRDLPPSLWHGTPVTEELMQTAERLDAWHLLPAPFPVQEVLPPDTFRHLKHLYGIGGLSYGNLSARHEGDTFWMSASGVHKGRLREIGRDVLLVKGYDPEVRAMRLSVPPHVEPRRVSVDAIEHWMVYRAYPSIGAILHVHAWVDGVDSTEINYPCGTLEMGQAVTELLGRQPDPGRAIIGMRNHGITATGPNFRDILQRLEGRVKTQVPMF